MAAPRVTSSKRAVYAALTGNLAIAVTKTAAAAYTGSSAMLSEAVHSLVDTGNQGLVLYGMHRARRPADRQHPFGYGMEVYFWTFLVAILIFGVGAGASALEGVRKLAAPHPVTDPWVNYAVLGMAMVFEGASWGVAFHEFGKVRGRRGLLDAVRRSKDPSLFTVLFEDTAAIVGLVVAMVGIALGQALDLPQLDAVASLVIAVVLAATAAFLAYECKSLLLGEAAAPAVVERIRREAMATPGVRRVNELLTMHLGPRDVLVTLSVDFADTLTAGAIEAAISELEGRIKRALPEVTRVFVEAQNWQASRREARAARRRRG